MPAAQVVAGRGATETLSKIAATAKDNPLLKAAKDNPLLKAAAALPIRRSKERDSVGAGDGNGARPSDHAPAAGEARSAAAVRLPGRESDASLFDQDFFEDLATTGGSSGRRAAGAGSQAQPSKASPDPPSTPPPRARILTAA